MPRPPDSPEPDAEPKTPVRRITTDWASLGQTGGSLNGVEPVLSVNRIRPVTLARTNNLNPHQVPRQKPEDKSSQIEAEHLDHLARVLERAAQVLGSDDAVLAWLKTPHPQLAGNAPGNLLRTDAGLTLVLDVLDDAKTP